MWHVSLLTPLEWLLSSSSDALESAIFICQILLLLWLVLCFILSFLLVRVGYCHHFLIRVSVSPQVCLGYSAVVSISGTKRYTSSAYSSQIDVTPMICLFASRSLWSVVVSAWLLCVLLIPSTKSPWLLNLPISCVVCHHYLILKTAPSRIVFMSVELLLVCFIQW